MNAPVRILVVEDNPAGADFIRETLPETGPVVFRVESVVRLAEALTRLQNRDHDLVLLDLGLPDSQGLETLRQLHQAAPEVPVVVMTGTDDQDSGVAAMQEGAQDYLVKGQVTENLLVRSIQYARERHKFAAAMRDSEARFRLLFNSSQDAVFVHAAGQGKFIEVNDVACQKLGYTREEFLHMSAVEIDAPEVRAAAAAMVEKLKHEPGALWEGLHVAKDGRKIPVEISTQKFFLDGRPTLLSTVRDITERKQAAAAHARLVTAVEQAAETIVITDLQGAILYANPAFEKTSGYPRSAVLGKNPRFLKSGRHDAEYYRQMWATLARGEVWSGHFINRRQDGTLYEEEATISPVRDAAGALINYVAVKRDVTREVQLDAQLRQMQKMEAIGQLAGGVAHDFNNILTGLLLQVNMLETIPNLPAEVREGLEEIRQASHSAADLTRQLLMFSRRQVMQPGHLDLNTVVTKLAKMLQRLLGADVRLQLHLHPAPLMICADPGMIEQVLMNLAVNARDAMPGGGRLMIITSETRVNEALASQYPDARPGRYVSVSVNDTGTGIPPEVFPRIFEPFFTTKEVGKGTGLGLATVFGIVKQHQGWIKVDNQPGRGVTFQIFLPVSPGPAAAAPPVAAPSRSPRGTKTILMVEDEPMIRGTVRKLLECNGYQVLVAANGIEALHLWLEHQAAVSLLLTDLVMPGGVSGQELARRLKKGAPQLKIVFMSGYNVDLAGQKLALDGGDKFVQKPFAPRQLLQVIQESLAV